ncbi:MAG: sigma-70 family RNA polymerase sigma factor [Saccharofermentans sp.]|nr:sigma-70 family RNA polymerase sigma factor [Saccharofermentans sp.]
MTDREFEKIYNEAYRAVYWTAMSLLKNEADAEDIVQETFVSLIESYDSLNDKDKVIPWLKKIAANKCLNRLTRTKTDTVEDEFFENVEAVAEDFLPDSIIESEEARRIVMDIINNKLSDDIRRTLILFYFDDLSTREIAEALGVPEGTVRRRLNFARNKIKKEVEKYEEDNDTKLFGMAIPFLTKLFVKESEQVALKPMPASLANLSASTEASGKGVNIKASAEAIKKGTDIMKTKILIGSIAAVVAVGATIGIIAGVVNRKNDKKQEDTVITEENVSGKETTGNPDVTVTESGADNSSQSDNGLYYGYFIITDSVNGENEKYFVVDVTHASNKDAQENVKGEIVIPDGVTVFSFKGFKHITKVVVPESVTELQWGAFESCESLEEVILPDTITTINGDTFLDCPNIKKVVMPKSLKHLVTGNDFYRSGVEEVYFPAEVELETYIDGKFTTMPIGNGLTVYVVQGSWLDIHFEEIYVDKSSDTINGVNTAMPKKAYWDGVHTN